MLEKVMKGVLLILAAIIMGLVVAMIIGLPVMLLWNWLMPELFGGPTVTFWQAVGLAVLGSLLTGASVKSK
jgi:hypothetical protein